MAVLALGGVLLSQWKARVVLQRQLDHDSLQRVREREMSLRREVYLEAASAIVHLQTLLGQAANIVSDEVRPAQTVQPHPLEEQFLPRRQLLATKVTRQLAT